MKKSVLLMKLYLMGISILPSHLMGISILPSLEN